MGNQQHIAIKCIAIHCFFNIIGYFSRANIGIILSLRSSVRYAILKMKTNMMEGGYNEEAKHNILF